MNQDSNREDRAAHEAPHVQKLWSIMRKNIRVCVSCAARAEYEEEMPCPCGQREES
jgi:hypothetical protein